MPFILKSNGNSRKKNPAPIQCLNKPQILTMQIMKQKAFFLFITKYIKNTNRGCILCFTDYHNFYQCEQHSLDGRDFSTQMYSSELQWLSWKVTYVTAPLNSYSNTGGTNT